MVRRKRIDGYGAPRKVVKERLGVRAVILGGLAALSTFDPSLAFSVGVPIALLVLVTGRILYLKMTSAVLFFVAFILWVTFSLAWTTNRDPFNDWITWVSLAVIFIAILDCIKTKRQLRAIAIGYLTGTLISVTRIVNAGPVIDGDQIGERVTVVGNVNVNYLAYAIATGFALVVLLWVTGKRSKLGRLALVITAAALFVGIWISDTRGAYAGIICALIWVVVWAIFRLRTLFIISGALTVFAALLVLGTIDQASLAFEAGSRATGDWSGRLPIWEASRAVWDDHLFLGTGVGGFRLETGMNVAAHNSILEIGATFGVIGLALYLGVLVSALWVGTRRAPARKRALLIGSILAASAPAYLTGAWLVAPAGWVALAIFARIGVLEGETEPRRVARGRSRPHAVSVASSLRGR